MDPEKKIMDAETERKLREVLPFEEGEHAEVTLDIFKDIPEEERPYYHLCPLNYDQRQAAAKEMVSDKGLSLATITKILQEGVLIGWKGHKTRSRPDIPFSLEEIGKMAHGWRSALFWKAWNFDNPNALERQGLG